MRPIHKEVLINASIDDVWAALTEPDSIHGWMGADSSVQVDLKVGGSYRLFGGETRGTFTKIKKPNTLEYTWRQGEWKKEWKDSVVRWELKKQRAKTKVNLTHSKFPNQQERDGHDEGWDVYFLDPLKEWLENRK